REGTAPLPEQPDRIRSARRATFHARIRVVAARKEIAPPRAARVDPCTYPPTGRGSSPAPERYFSGRSVRQSQAQANLISRSTVALDRLRMPAVSSAVQLRRSEERRVGKECRSRW